MIEAKRKYRAPSVTVDASVCLDQFDNEEILEYLKHQGVPVNDFGGGAPDAMDAGLLIYSADLDTINTLALCGQIGAAREHALRLVSIAIGRPL